MYNFKDNQLDFFGNFYTLGADFTGKYKFPVLQQQRNLPDKMALPINYMLSTQNLNDNWFHCFVGDKQFNRFWYSFDKYIPYLKSVGGIISTDFSIYRNDDEDIQIRNIYRNRVMAYAMQKVNPNTIPTAGFGAENTWNWCFDGLPFHSTVAITTNGTLTDPEAQRLFVGGVDALVQTVKPYALVICGNYPNWLNTKYPNIIIIPIFNYSQMRKLRRCG